MCKLVIFCSSLIIGSCLMNVAVFGASTMSDYPCYRLSKPPTLDGRIEPEVWASIPEAGGSYYLKQGDRIATRPTRFKAGWTPMAIYLAIRCTEPSMGTLKAIGNEGDSLWREDSVDVCFSLPGARIHYITNSSGTRWQAKWLVVFAKDMGAWQARALRGKDEWTLEIMIPFSDCNKTPVDQERWSFGLARNIPRPSSTVTGAQVDYCTLANVNGLIFENREIKTEEISEIERNLALIADTMNQTCTTLMRSGADEYKSGDYIGARRDYEAASILTTDEAQRAQALLQLGHCLFALSARLPGEGATRPNRDYAQRIYEQVVEMPGALPETRSKAQVSVVYCLVNVGECDKVPAVKAACEKALTMPGLDHSGKLEMLKILCDMEMAARNFGAARTRCLQIRDLVKGGESKEREPVEGHWMAPGLEGMDQRLSLLENWEQMRKTPSETFNRSYERETTDAKATAVLPSIQWAKPGQGKPLRALVMCYLNGIREIAELAQRMELDPVIVTTADREHFYFEGYGEKYPSYYAPLALGVNQYGGIPTRNVRETFERVLDQTVDVMILAGLDWSGMPLSVREKILKKVEMGSALICKTSQPDELFRAATTNKVSSVLTFLYPFKGLPVFTRYTDKTTWQDAVVGRYRHGKGEIWVVKGYETPDYQILTPGALSTASETKLVEYDYYLAFIIQLIRQAAGVKTSVRITGQDAWETSRNSTTPLLFQLESDNQIRVTCAWTVRNRDNRILARKQEEMTLKPGTNAVRYVLGKSVGNECFVDLQVKDGNVILDFGSVYVRAKLTSQIARAATLSKTGEVANSYLAEYLSAGHNRAGVGKVMNNFVIELLKVSRFSGKEVETFTFENPRAGWVFLMGEVKSLGAGDSVSVSIGKKEDSCNILMWDGKETKESQKETMRYLESGRYRVFVGSRGKARLQRLIIHTVPEIVYFPYPTEIAKNLSRAIIDWKFLKKHILGSTNVVMGVSLGRGGDTLAPVKEVMEWKAQGGKWFSQATVPYWHPNSEVPRADEVVQFWTTGDLEMGYVDGLTCDEFTIAHLPKQQQKYEVFCQALRQIKANPLYRGKRVDPYFGLGSAYFFRSAFRQISETGYKMQLERYLVEQPTREAAARTIAQAYDLDMEPFLEVSAQPQQHILHVFCPVNTHTYMDVNPGVNYKVFLDMQFNYLANAPACAGLYGVAPWHCSGCDEEIIRWLGRLYRHYCIEGRRDLLSRDPYELNHIQNPDFTEGLKEWNATAAEVDSIKALTLPSLNEVQWRGGGGECVSMRRSAKGPNRLMQTIRNLEKGRFYSVGFYTFNPKKDDPDTLHAVTVGVEGGEVLQPLCSQAILEKLNWHFVVFRAQSPTASLSISDWHTSSDPGGKVGQELLYDFIQIQPYFTESQSEVS